MPPIVMLSHSTEPSAAGLSYAAFLDAWQQKLAAGTTGLDPQARRYYFYAKYNWERAEAVQAAYAPSEGLRRAMEAVQAPQHWIVLTEDWCVDSAFVLPVVARAAALSPLVTLRIFPRDQHPEVMDRYLTNGARSVPKLVAFGPEGAELFQWGPRTEEASARRQQLVAEGLDKAAISAQMVAWNEAGGWRGVEAELARYVAEACERVETASRA